MNHFGAEDHTQFAPVRVQNNDNICVKNFLGTLNFLTTAANGPLSGQDSPKLGSLSVHSPLDVCPSNLKGVCIVFQETAVTPTLLNIHILPPPVAGQL